MAMLLLSAVDEGSTGEIDPATGQFMKPPVQGRTIRGAARRDILRDVSRQQISPVDAEKLVSEILASPEAPRLADELGMSIKEYTAYMQGTPFDVIARWRYDGWPTVCSPMWRRSGFRRIRLDGPRDGGGEVRIGARQLPAVTAVEILVVLACGFQPRGQGGKADVVFGVDAVGNLVPRVTNIVLP